MIMLLGWIGLGLVVGVLARWIFPARAHGWKRRGVAFAVAGGLAGNMLFSGNLFAMDVPSWVGVGCGSFFVLGYAMLLRAEVIKRIRDVRGVPADVPREAGSKPIVKHEPTPPSY